MKLITCYDIRPDYYIDESGNIFRGNRQLKSHITKHGYLQIRLMCNNRRGSFLVHRLVALTYLPESYSDEKNTVNHIDENKINNHYTNLEWVDMLTNVNISKQGDYVDISEELVDLVIADLEAGEGHSDIALKHNCSASFIRRISQGKRHSEKNVQIINSKKT